MLAIVCSVDGHCHNGMASEMHRASARGLWMIRRVEKMKKIVQDRRWVFLVTVILLVTSSLTAAAAAQHQSARNVFNSTCASCHCQNGVPTAVGKSLNAPELGSAAVQKQTTAQLQQIISGGKGNMPPFQASLSEAQISSLAA
jgi:mono/diheme cytochrome c family protein